MSKTITWSRCPNCKKTLSVSSRPGMMTESKIGETKITICPKCGAKVSNGKKEWPVMTGDEKAIEIIRFIFLDAITSGIICFLIILLLSTIDKMATNTIVILGVFTFLVVFFLTFLINKAIINSSIKRYNQFDDKKIEYFNLIDKNFDLNKIQDDTKNTNILIAELVKIISKYKEYVEGLEEVTLGAFPEKNVYKELFNYLDKLITKSSYLYYKGLLFNIFHDKIESPEIIDELDKIDNELNNYIYQYFPKDFRLEKIRELNKSLDTFLLAKEKYKDDLSRRINFFKSFKKNDHEKYSTLFEFIKYLPEEFTTEELLTTVTGFLQTIKFPEEDNIDSLFNDKDVSNPKTTQAKVMYENEYKVSSSIFNKIIEITPDPRKVNMINKLYVADGDFYIFKDCLDYDLESQNRIKEYMLEKIKELNS